MAKSESEALNSGFVSQAVQPNSVIPHASISLCAEGGLPAPLTDYLRGGLYEGPPFAEYKQKGNIYH